MSSSARQRRARCRPTAASRRRPPHQQALPARRGFHHRLDPDHLGPRAAAPADRSRPRPPGSAARRTWPTRGRGRTGRGRDRRPTSPRRSLAPGPSSARRSDRRSASRVAGPTTTACVRRAPASRTPATHGPDRWRARGGRVRLRPARRRHDPVLDRPTRSGRELPVRLRGRVPDLARTTAAASSASSNGRRRGAPASSSSRRTPARMATDRPCHGRRTPLWRAGCPHGAVHQIGAHGEGERDSRTGAGPDRPAQRMVGVRDGQIVDPRPPRPPGRRSRSGTAGRCRCGGRRRRASWWAAASRRAAAKRARSSIGASAARWCVRAAARSSRCWSGRGMRAGAGRGPGRSARCVASWRAIGPKGRASVSHRSSR